MFRVIAVSLSSGMYAAVLQDVASGLFYDAGCGEFTPWTLTPLGDRWQSHGRDNFFELPDTWGEVLTGQYTREAVSQAYSTCDLPVTMG